MRIAVINETSAADRNADILLALEGRGHEVFNCGMKKGGEAPELSYIHTGFLAALILAMGKVDFVIGGCGTGQGFLNAAMAYPGVSCGHILTPLDAWLFARINDGNCISLALNQGYGWAADVNLRLIFDELFSSERGSGYPKKRSEPQAFSRRLITQVSAITHHSFQDIVSSLPDEVALPALRYPGIFEFLLDGIKNGNTGSSSDSYSILARAVEARLHR
ncbi:MAG: RpiB/LacA/LacB family sugar-phosphate isomerase [Spirochaetes bacterium]|nr:RpiB/LacA/LacB family sugar-phosphate isomerase [Spirochaetota bacterium]